MSAEEGDRRMGAAGARREAELPLPPPQMEPPETPAQTAAAPALSPRDTANVLEGVSPQRAQPFPAGPDYGPALDAMRAGAPQMLQDAPDERMWRLIAGALGAGYGPDGPAGAPAGLAAAAAGEGQRSREMGARNNAQQLEFSRGLAALLGDQATGGYRAAADAATFDQRERNLQADNRRADQQLGLQREELGIKREDAAARRELTAQNQLLSRLRLQMTLRNAGLDVNAQDLLSRALPEAVRNNSPILVTGEDGSSSPLMLPVPGEYQGPARRGEPPRQLAMMTPDRARRAITETLGRDPAYATQAGNIPNVANGILSQLYATAISRLPPDQQQQALRQLQRWMENRPRAGTTELD